MSSGRTCIGDKAELTSSLPQTDVFAVRGERYLRGVFVADVGIESGHQHQGVVEMFLDTLVVRLDSRGAAQRKRIAAVSQEFGGNQHIVKDHRFVHVQLKVTLRACERDSVVISEDLDGDHGQGLTLRRIDFSRHDGGSGFVLVDAQFADARAWAARVPANIVSDLHEGPSQGTQRAAEAHHCVVSGENRELVGSGYERLSCLFGDSSGCGFAKACVRVESGTDCGAANGQCINGGKHPPDAFNRVIELADPSGADLPESEGPGVLQVRASRDDDVAERL